MKAAVEPNHLKETQRIDQNNKDWGGKELTIGW